jgi:hypothetical protein
VDQAGLAGDSGEAGLGASAAGRGAGSVTGATVTGSGGATGSGDAGEAGEGGVGGDTGLGADTGSGDAGLAGDGALTGSGLAGLAGDDALAGFGLAGLTGESGSGDAGERGDVGEDGLSSAALLRCSALVGELALDADAVSRASGDETLLESGVLTSSAVLRITAIPPPGTAVALEAGTSCTPGPPERTPSSPDRPIAPAPKASAPLTSSHFLVSAIRSSWMSAGPCGGSLAGMSIPAVHETSGRRP